MAEWELGLGEWEQAWNPLSLGLGFALPAALTWYIGINDVTAPTAATIVTIARIVVARILIGAILGY